MYLQVSLMMSTFYRPSTFYTTTHIKHGLKKKQAALELSVGGKDKF